MATFAWTTTATIALKLPLFSICDLCEIKVGKSVILVSQANGVPNSVIPPIVFVILYISAILAGADPFKAPEHAAKVVVVIVAHFKGYDFKLVRSVLHKLLCFVHPAPCNAGGNSLAIPLGKLPGKVTRFDIKLLSKIGQ